MSLTTPVEFGQFRYQARLARVIDGDTLSLTVDLGFHIHHARQRFRLEDIDTAETYGVAHDSEEYQQGVEHTRYVQGWLADAADGSDEWPLVIETAKDSKGRYGRWIAHVWRKSDGRSLSRSLLEEFGEDVRY